MYKDELAELLSLIEALRRKLNELGSAYSFTDPKFIETSHQLDAVLNRYHKLLKK